MAIRLNHNGLYYIDGILDKAYRERWEAEQDLRAIKMLVKAKRQGRRLRGKPPIDNRKRNR